MSEPGAASSDRRRDGARTAASPGGPVTVLGGTGLIGSATVRAFLDAGRSVSVLARHAPDERRAPLLDGATIFLGDAGDPRTLAQALDGATHVVDALGAPHPAASAEAPLAQFEAELPVLLAVLELLQGKPETGFTYLSSGGAIYGDVDVLPVSENAECHPVSPYGVTKLAAERYVLLAANRHGADVRVLRVANAYGATQRPRTGQGVIAALLHGASTGEPVRLFGDGSSIRDYVDARDVATAAVALSASVDRRRVVNVGSGVGHRLDEVVGIVEEVTASRVPIERAPWRESDVRAITLDVRRLAGMIEWHPRDLRVGVADAWHQWQQWASVAGSATS